jgi:hypothetical protein
MNRTVMVQEHIVPFGVIPGVELTRRAPPQSVEGFVWRLKGYQRLP